MRELKSRHVFDVYEDYTKTGDDERAQVYLKSEADAAIEEIKDELVGAQFKLNRAHHTIVDLQSKVASAIPLEDLVKYGVKRRNECVHSISWAFDRLKEGKRIRRASWKDKGLYVVLKKGYPAEIPRNSPMAKARGLTEDCSAYMLLELGDGSRCIWAPNIGDCLSDDWAIA